MKFPPLSLWLPYILMSILFVGCTTLILPQYGSGTVTITEGGLVETISFEGGAMLNIQITRERLPENDYLCEHVMTIGKFSPIIGSGFTRREDIYYESVIGEQGHDTFVAGTGTYSVRWNETEVIPGRKNMTTSVFSVTVRQLNQ